MSSERRRERAGRGWRGRDKERVLAAIVSRFADAVARFRGRRGEITWTTEVHLGDDDEGGLAASGVRRRPPDRSGSGSAALPEPTEDESSDSGFYTRPGT